MKLIHFLITGLGLPSSTTHCDRYLIPTHADKPSGDDTECQISISFSGKTKNYRHDGTCQLAVRETTQFWYLDTHCGSDDYLSIALCDVGSDRFSFGYSHPDQLVMSILTYSISQQVYTSYGEFTDWQAGLSAPQGCIQIEQLKPGRKVRLSFCGTLSPRNEGRNQGPAVPISGHFCLVY